MEPTINLQLTIAEVNYILNVLTQRPYAEVHSLVTKIKMQGDPQATMLTAENVEVEEIKPEGAMND